VLPVPAELVPGEDSPVVVGPPRPTLLVPDVLTLTVWTWLGVEWV
jgi:hypothetical protein